MIESSPWGAPCCQLFIRARKHASGSGNEAMIAFVAVTGRACRLVACLLAYARNAALIDCLPDWLWAQAISVVTNILTDDLITCFRSQDFVFLPPLRKQLQGLSSLYFYLQTIFYQMALWLGSTHEPIKLYERLNSLVLLTLNKLCPLVESSTKDNK